MKPLLQNLNSRTLLNIGLFIFIVVLVLVLSLEPGKQAPPKTVHLTELKQAEITDIELKRKDATDIQLHKRDGIWYITRPYQLLANDFRAQSVSALAEAKSHLQYDAGSMDLAKFKLDKPEVSITLNKSVTLDIGGVDPIKNRRYVKQGQTLHLVNDTFYYQIIGKATAYLSYQLLSADIKLSKLVLPNFTLTQQGGDWQLSPAQKETSADSINEFVNEWRHAQSLEISEYQGKPRKANIHIYQEGQAKPIAFTLQKEHDNTYLIRNDLKLRYKLSDEMAEKLQTIPEPIQPVETADEPPGSEQAPAN